MASDEIRHTLERLTHAPYRLEQATRGVETARLYLRSDVEPWSVSDILAHLRACSDVWGKSIVAMLMQDKPTMRYVSPRASLKKPMYHDQAFDKALASFTQARQRLVATLTELDAAGWVRPGTFTGVSPRQRDQTVLSYAERIVNHEQPHLAQIEALLQ